MTKIVKTPQQFNNWAEAYSWLHKEVINRVNERRNTDADLRMLCRIIGITPDEVEAAVKRGST